METFVGRSSCCLAASDGRTGLMMRHFSSPSWTRCLHLPDGVGSPSFDPSEPESHRRDVPKAEVHVVDGGHFALDTAADLIAQIVRGFVGSSR
jgi:hypothetical protein